MVALAVRHEGKIASFDYAQDDKLRAFARLKAELSSKVGPASLAIEGAVPTAIPELDRLLAGGFPPGVVVTLEGTTGRWSLAAGLVAELTRRSLVAILDDGTLYPPSLAEAGARLEHVLVVPARRALEVARAVDILLRSRICRLVLMPAIVLRDAIWSRLAMLAHRSGVLLIVMVARAGAALSAVAELRLYCAFERAIVHGKSGLWGSFAGFDFCIDLRKHKHLPSALLGTTRLRAALR
ncbi:MAG: hypothetical protein WAJ94_06770 [Candidatus Cybelea sp.]